jgi:ubiquitin
MENISKQNNENKISPLKTAGTRLTRTGVQQRFDGNRWRTLCKCKKARPSYNLPGKSQAICCRHCKTPEMIDVKHKRCICGKAIPIYNLPGETKPICCVKCKTPEMIDVKHKRCICGKAIPIYNLPGETKPICCVKCKTPEMIDVKNKRCECGKSQPSYNLPGETKPYCCVKCKTSDMIDVKNKRCEYDCCIFLDIPSRGCFKNYYNRYQNICWAAAKNQMYDQSLTIQQRESIGNYYGFGNVNLVLRQEHAVLHLINATQIGNILRTETFGHSFDTDPIAKIFGKNKNIHHKQPDYCVLVNKYSIIIIEYDENSSHEKSRARLNEIQDMFHLNVKQQIRDIESYTTSTSSSSSQPFLKNVHVIRINGRDDDNEKRVCIKKERKESDGDYTYKKRYYELSEHGMTVVMEVILLLEEIYNQILDSDVNEKGLQVYEIN